MGIYDDIVNPPANTSGGIYDDIVNPQSRPNAGIGIAKSLGTGAVEGFAGTPGVPGDVQTLAKKGVQKLGLQTPEHPGAAPVPSFMKDWVKALGFTPASETHAAQLPTSAETIGATERNVTGPLYQPQNKAEEYARTIGQFFPAVVGNPASLARAGLSEIPGMVGARALYGAALPGAATQAAGDVTNAVGVPELTPYARLAAGVLAGPTIARAHNAITEATAASVAAAKNAKTGDLTRNLTAGQMVGSAEKPLGGAGTEEMTNNLFGDWTREFLSNMGLNARQWKDANGNSLISQRMRDLGNEVKGIGQRNDLVATRAGVQGLDATYNSYINRITDPNEKAIVGQEYMGMRTALANNAWKMPGSNVVQLSSDLAERARGMNNPLAQRALYSLRENLHDMFEASMSPADRGQYASLRNQQRHGIILQRAADSNNADVQRGFLNPEDVLNAKKAEDGRGSISNLRGDLEKMASAGVALKVGTPAPPRKTFGQTVGPELPLALGLPAIDAAVHAAAGGGAPSLSELAAHALMGFGGGAALKTAFPAASATVPGRAFLKNQAFPTTRSMIPYYAAALAQPSINAPGNPANPP